MRRLVALACALTGLVASGCGSSTQTTPPTPVCPIVGGGISHFNAAIAPCEVDAGQGVRGIVFDESTCGAGLAYCSPEDAQALTDWGVCLNALPTCDPTNKHAFQVAYNACVVPNTTTCAL